MATKITNPSVPEEQVSNAEDVQKTSASEAPAAELVTVAVPAEDPAGEPVAAAVGETAAEPPVEAAAPAEEPVGAAPALHGNHIGAFSPRRFHETVPFLLLLRGLHILPVFLLFPETRQRGC